MSKKNNYILLFLLISFSIYCSLTIGESWDERWHLISGKNTFNYIFSLGNNNKEYLFREFYSPMYWTWLYFVTEMFPSIYQIKISHLLNLFLSLGTIFGTGKLCRELFNKQVGNISILLLFFYPIFFGNMAFNSSDTVHAFTHVWITYLLIRYIKKQYSDSKTSSYVIYLGFLTALSTGIQLGFLGSLIPIFIFILMEIFLFKKIVTKIFSIKKLAYDLVKCILIFYTILVVFWIDVHGNILVNSFDIFVEFMSNNFWTGYPYNLVNGNYFESSNVPSSYIILNLIFKSPEYFLMLYIVFVFLIIKDTIFFEKKFNFIKYKLILLINILIFPTFLIMLIPFPIYDGMRLFLWSIPYYSIIPSLVIFYLLNNIQKKIPKYTLVFLSLFIVYFLFNFFSLTPYQYTYLNRLNGINEIKYKKFENDYTGSSLHELIQEIDFDKNDKISVATCGVSLDHVKYFIKKRGYININFVSSETADYIIMTNRVSNADGLINCFDKFSGGNIFKVERNGLILSVVRKI